MLTLCELPLEIAERQVDWLARLLSARGIPSLCLEVHLGLLHQALAVDGAPALDGHDIPGALERRLSARRAEVLSAERFDALSEVEVPGLGEGAGRVLLGAVVDQRLGIAPCADNLRGWVSEEPRLDGAARSEILRIIDQFLLEGVRS